MTSGDLIRGFVTKVMPSSETSGKLNFQLWLNGKINNETLEYKFDKTKRSLVAEGALDVMDYAMSKPLKALNKACYALHKGKTWSDVKLKLEMQLSPCFKF